MLSPAAMEVLRQLFMTGPVWDGNITSKSGRDELIDWTLAARHNGWTILTMNGLRRSLKLRLDREKGTSS
jgi:hypothetical protein